ncbi:unnamed protein product [Owenia fusiformis]|uniref:CCHC-type domain-containing protein n=1 Tax=Owenia fusiformis TaxID=6347 RepID=A0A8S4PTK5_OWEFU|nr:unnamed protein product [Owenia fusiformis]
MTSKIDRTLTLKTNHRATGWAKEETLLQGILNTVDESDVIAIQITKRDVYFTFRDRHGKDNAKRMGFMLNDGLTVELEEVEDDTIYVTLRDIPIEVSDKQIVDYISQFATVNGGVTHGYIKRLGGEKTNIRNGMRFISVKDIKRPIPNNPTIAGFLGRLSYRGQPCSVCGGLGHPWYRCEQREKPKCFKCNQFNHFAKDCTAEKKCFKCFEPGHEAKSCPGNRTVTEEDQKDDEQQRTPVPTDTVVIGCSIARGVYTEMKRSGVENRTQGGAQIEDVPALLRKEPLRTDDLKQIIVQVGTKNIVLNKENTEDAIIKYNTVVDSMHSDYPDTQIVVSSIPPVHPYNKSVQAKINQFNKQLDLMCKNSDFLVFVSNDAMLLSNQRKTSANDFKSDDTKGIHLSPHGYEKVVHNINTAIKKRKSRGSEGSTPSSQEKASKKKLFSEITQNDEPEL